MTSAKIFLNKASLIANILYRKIKTRADKRRRENDGDKEGYQRQQHQQQYQQEQEKPVVSTSKKIGKASVKTKVGKEEKTASPFKTHLGVRGR